MDLELGGSYQSGTIVQTHKSDQSGEGTLSSLIQDIYTENKVGMENTNLNESWHRIILFLQAKCVCVCDSSLPGGDILVMPQLSNSQDVWNYCVKFCATFVQSFPDYAINRITVVPQHTHCLEKHPEKLGSTP